MVRKAVTAFLLLAGLTVAAAEPDWYYLDPDSMPRLATDKLFYLEQKHGLCPKPRDDGESLNVKLVGKWGGGPSWAVTGKDTLVYLSRGSEVVVISFADTANPQILNYIQAKRLGGRPVLVDTLLYLATSGYIEVFNVADPTNAPRIGRLATPVADIDVEDTLVYCIGADSFKVFDFSDPASPRLVGACIDSGYALDFDRGYAYLRDRWGMYILDVRVPASPHRVASWGADIAGVKVRGNHCYVAQGSMGSNSLHVLNVSNPASPWQEGILSGLTGEDVYLVDTLLFMPGFDVVNIADSSRPRAIAHTEAGGYEVWVHGSLRLGVTAGWTGGLRVLNLTDISNPVLDTSILGMYAAMDISVKDGVACIATGEVGMLLFDISDPVHISELGWYDSASARYTTALLNADTVAFVSAFNSSPREVFHSVDISDPAHPVRVGAGIGFNPVEAMALRDSFLYCAEDYKFEVFNVANPRQPVWMGRCNLSTSTSGISIQDTLAYLAPNIYVINVAQPAQPVLVGQTSCNCNDVAVRDTYCYVAHAYESLKVYSVANPSSPRRLTSVWVPGQAYTVALRDSYAGLGCNDFRVFDIGNPASPVLTGYYATPYRTRSLDFDSLYAYVACYLAGVEVLELLPVGISEPGGKSLRPRQCEVWLSPNPARYRMQLSWSGFEEPPNVQVLDPAGRVVLRRQASSGTDRTLNIGLGCLKPGVYFLRCSSGETERLIRFVRI
jgi:hypothetical protein